MRQVKPPYVAKVRDITEEANRAMRRSDGLSEILIAEEQAEGLTETNSFPEPAGWDEQF